MIQRYLNKIVFIKSAGAEYQEVDLQGNIHFVGDQGAGKTTILRAIMYFYNPSNRKERLGIKHSERTFAEFYFPYQNSYVIYEVRREDNPFFVWLFAENRRPVFYFVDCNYDKDLFFDKNLVVLDPIQIRDKFREKNIFFSRKVTKISDYKSIIYGSIKEIKLKDFYILKSFKFQSVANTISNIFLNAQLDASRIKQTIIDALFSSDDEFYETQDIFEIDLDKIRRQLLDFKEAYNDVLQFNRRKKRQINNIVKAARDTKNSLYRSGEIIFIVRSLAKRLEIDILPKYKADLDNLKLKKRVLSEELEKMRKENEKVYQDFNGKISVLDHNLTKAKEKERYWFEKKNIESIKRQIENEPSLKIELGALKEKLEIIRSKELSIIRKYEQLQKSLDLEKQQKLSEISQKENNVNKDFINEKEKISEQRQQEIEKRRREFDMKISQALNQQGLLNEQLNDLKEKSSEIFHTEFHKEQIDNLKQEIDRLHDEIKKFEFEIAGNEKDIKILQEQLEIKIKYLEENYYKDKEKIEEKLLIIDEQIAVLDAKIKNFSDTFYSELDVKLPGWKNNIGKVAREELLLSKDIYFDVVDPHSDLFFGLRIDIEALPFKLKTLEDYQKELQKLTQEKDSKLKDKATLMESFNVHKVQLQQTYSKRIGSLRKQIINIEQQKVLYQSKIKKKKTLMDNLIQRAQTEKQKKLEQVNKQIEVVSREIIEMRDNRNWLEKERQKVLAEIDKYYNDLLRQRQLQRDEELKNLKEKKENIIKEYLRRKSELEQQEKKELANRNIDFNEKKTVETKIKEKERQLDKLAELKNIFAKFEKDKEEFIDKIPQWKRDLEHLQEEFMQVRQQSEQRERNLIVQLDNLDKKIESLNKQIDNFNFQLKRYRDFQSKIENWASEVFTFLGDKNYSDLQYDRDLSLLIDDLIKSITEYNDHKERLKRFINSFSSDLRDNNIFGWKKNFYSDHLMAYFDYADELDEYIRENKILIAENRLKDTYIKMLDNFSSEIVKMEQKFSEIKSVVRELNQGFKQINFVRAIEYFNMDIISSGNAVVNVLRDINKFKTEQPVIEPYQLNIFTDAESFEKNKNKAFTLLKNLLIELENYANRHKLSLEDIFDIKFTLIQNGRKHQGANLHEVGSHGTDILLKAMIYIMLLDVFKTRATKKNNRQSFYLHCIMDEIGRIHSKNVESLISFANERGIWMIFGSPNPDDNPTIYRAIYQVDRINNNLVVKKLIFKNE